MKVETLNVSARGYVHCRSNFYRVSDLFHAPGNIPGSKIEYRFLQGLNRMYGDVDSGIWAISYFLSMYSVRPKDFVLFEQMIELNGKVVPLKDVLQISCYMDETYPLFSHKRISIKKIVEKLIRKNKMDCTAEDIRRLFHIEEFRFERPVHQVGNSVFRCMAAIGYCAGKEIFCFPWMSDLIFKSYTFQMTLTLDILTRLDKTVILPTGEDTGGWRMDTTGISPELKKKHDELMRDDEE